MCTIRWTPGLEGGLAGAMYGGQGAGEGQEKREMEHGLTFSMLGVRVAEMKGGWLENQHDLLAVSLRHPVRHDQHGDAVEDLLHAPP